MAELWEINEEAVRQMRKENDLIPVYKMVDTCAAEFESKTPYFYSSYEYENESSRSEKPSILVLGSGPIRIGQGLNLTMRLCILSKQSSRQDTKQSS